MISVTASILVSLFFLVSMSTVEKGMVPAQEIKVPVIPINASDLPLKISRVTIESSFPTSWLNFSIKNSTTDRVNRVDLRIWITDGTGIVISRHEATFNDSIAAGANQKGRTFIKTPIRPKELPFLAITRIVTRSGVWQVDPASLEGIVRGRLSCQTECPLSTTFELHRFVSNNDRAEIFRLLVNNLLEDHEKKAILQDQPDLIVLRSGVNFPLPNISGKTLVALSDREIQEIADQIGRIIFLKYEPLRVEGSRVVAKIAVRNAVDRRRGAFVQYRYVFQFTCIEEKEKWIIEASIGYAQS